MSTLDLLDETGALRPLAELEADAIRFALDRFGSDEGTITEIARRLGIGRSTIYRKMKAIGAFKPRRKTRKP